MNIGNENQSNSDPERTPVHWGWTVGAALGAMGSLGEFVNLLRAALSAASTPNPLDYFGLIFWLGIFGLCIPKYYGRNEVSGSVIGIAVGILATVGLVLLDGFTHDQVSPAAAIESQLKELNSDLPAMIDDGLRLDSYEAEGNVLVMNITTVGMQAAEIDVDSWMSESKSRVSDAACADPNYRQILETGVIYEYRYRDEEGIPVVTVRLSQSDCR